MALNLAFILAGIVILALIIWIIYVSALCVNCCGCPKFSRFKRGAPTGAPAPEGIELKCTTLKRPIIHRRSAPGDGAIDQVGDGNNDGYTSYRLLKPLRFSLIP